MRFECEVQEAINAVAWRDAITWAFGQTDFLEAFRADTGIDLLTKRGTMDFLVDEATGKMEADLSAFIDWFTEHHWGPDWDPRGES